MNWILTLDNVVSVGLICVLWTLAHQNSSGDEPWARTIGAGYSLCALTVLGSILFRDVPELNWLVEYVDLTVKSTLAFTLGAVANRLGLLHRRK